MLKKLTLFLIPAILILAPCFVSAGTQHTDLPANVQKSISPEKQALIKELLKVSQVKETLDQGTKQIFAQVETNYSQMMSRTLADAGDLQNVSKEDFNATLAESRPRFSSQFRELYSKRVKMGKLMEEVYYPLYNENFTEGEIKDLIKFYKTPTGKKSINVMPKLMQSAMHSFGKKVNPEIIHLITELVEKEKAFFLVKLKKDAKPQAKNNKNP